MFKVLANIGKSVVSGVGGAISTVTKGLKNVVATTASAVGGAVSGAVKSVASGGGIAGAIAGAIEGGVTAVAGGAVTPKPASVPASVFDVETQQPVVMDISASKTVDGVKDTIDTVKRGLEEVSNLLEGQKTIVKKPISLDYDEWVPYIIDWEKWKKG